MNCSLDDKDSSRYIYIPYKRKKKPLKIIQIFVIIFLSADPIFFKMLDLYLQTKK